ncbi:MAG: hypothetical protein KAT16_04220 [Candidatus Heimdallarchaeota archaeon]|nr:hypothetical protein [Candidatus Heimdallarchaeota archaeon]
MTQEKYRFDLSDGFGKEDILAVFAGIWNFITFILKLVFYPYVWIFRMFGRSLRFARTKKSPEKALDADERTFIESIPGFFVLVGFFGGILFAIIIWLTNETGLSDFLDNINLSSIIGGIFWFFNDIVFEIILWIIGIDDRSDPANVLDRFGLLDIFFDILYEGILLNIISIVTQDAIMTFIGIGIIGVIIAILWIIISETGIVGSVVGFFTRIFSSVVGVPSSVWNKSNKIYRNFNHILASIVIGQSRLDERNIGFHRKILYLTLGLGLYTLVFGLFVGITYPQEGINQTILYIFSVILGLGIGVGIIEMFLIVRILDIVSRKKYVTTSKVE